MSIAQHLARARRLAVLYEDALEHSENDAHDRCGEISADAMDDERRDGGPADGRGDDRGEAAATVAAEA